MKKVILSLILLLAPALWSQNVRWDWAATTTLSTSGTLVPVMAIRNAPVSFYTGCTFLPCLTYAQTYPSSTSAIACPSDSQVVLQNSTTCQSTADPSGNFGSYLPPGTYQYTITYANRVYGPYTFVITGGSGVGTLTNFSASGLSPLFSVGVSNPTLNPDLTFYLSNAGANTIFGNFSGLSGPPEYASYLCTGMVNCSYDSGTHTFTINVPTSATAITQLVGDVLAGPGTGVQTATLATVNTLPGTYGDSTHTVTVTVNQKGLSTVVSTNAIPTATNAALGLAQCSSPDTTCTGGAIGVTGVHGASIPISAAVTGTNGSGQFVAASASDINTLLANTRPWQASVTFLGVPANSQILLLVPTTVAVTIPSGCSGSYMGATVAATAITDFTINKLAGGPTGASTTLCTAQFAASPAVTASFSGTGGSLAAGDYLEILGPASADATLANIGGGIYGTH